MNNTITLLGECRLFSDLYQWIHHICLSLSYACLSDLLGDAHSWSLTHSDSVNHQTCEPKIWAYFEPECSDYHQTCEPYMHADYLLSFHSSLLLSVGCCLLAVRFVILFPTLIFFPYKISTCFFLYISQGKNNWSSFSNTVLVTKINYKYYLHTQHYS